jgi:hypothetical protein
LIYDVTYTIDADGLRIAAGLDENPHDNRCMLFFGCSFTFGEGVDDHEAMPYVAGTLANLRAYNFGFPGYGPHQMPRPSSTAWSRELWIAAPDGSFTKHFQRM